MDPGSPPCRRKKQYDPGWPQWGGGERMNREQQRARVVDTSAGSGRVKGPGEAARLRWGSEPKHPACQSPKIEGLKKEEGIKGRGPGSWKRTLVSEKQGQRHPGPPLPKLTRPQLAPGRGPSTLEFVQALVAGPLLPTPPLLMWLPAAACGRPNPCAQGTGTFQQGKK